MPPFQGWTHGFKVATRQDEKFIRLSGDGAKPIGRWIVREKDVANILHDPGALQKRLSLPEIPTHISDVRVPKDTEFYAGKVRSNFQGEDP